MGNAQANEMGAPSDEKSHAHSLKMREVTCRHGVQTCLSCLFLFLAVIGLCLVCFGIADLPKCRYGDNTCYFFVKICGRKFFDGNEAASAAAVATNSKECAWVLRTSRIEGSSDEGVQQFYIP